ncbi:MAG: LytTR family DNA-binding domain-containing protein [Clostridia bacterium]|nr:LytTR family DNA-binding domain-containing protein [Clostridia bacterium]
MLQIVLCEDNQLYLNSIANTVKKILSQNNINGKIVCKATDAKTVENYLKHNMANVFFLDIDLKSKETGYNLAEKIREYNIQAYIVFVTCHFEFVLQAFKVQCFDFLTKPVTEEILEQCLLRIYRNYLATTSIPLNNDRCIEIKSGSNIYKIKTKDIIYIERQGFRTIVYTVYSEISCYETLDAFEKMLSDKNFVRCHKSFIANKAYMSEIHLKEKVIFFETGQKCYIGPKYKKELVASV